MNYLNYARYYLGHDDLPASSYADRELSGVLTQAAAAGVNTALIRNSVGHDAQYTTNYFPGRADLVRSLGLNLILGGFGDVIDQPNHNIRVQNLISNYAALSAPPSYSPIVGIHGFDEPDNKWDANPDDRAAIRNALSNLHSWSSNLGYPLGSFLAKPALYVPSLAYPNSGTGLNATIYQICQRLDFPNA